VEVLSEIRNNVAILTLNRPAALNSLSLGMIVALRRELAAHAADDHIRAVLLRGAGDKAFCAGGDIRALYESFKESGSAPREFFVAEYPLDYSLYSFPKPHAVLMDGITMGGGMGLAQGSALRIVGDRTRMAMPEVGIGFFPDVGGSYFLSRLPGALGMYLALTGAQIRAADALYCGLADVYLPAAAVVTLATDLTALNWSSDPAADLGKFIRARATPIAAVAPLRALRPAIDKHFSLSSIRDILASLEAETQPEFANWAVQTAKLMRTRSPTMLAVTLRQLQRGKDMTLAECFRMELAMTQQCFEQGDFLEGVRALIIDKDNAPRWTPNRIEEVTDAMVDEFFRSRWTAATHPLATLQSSVTS
jgi:enoyl-CoA hydratase/carnithine racemase